jgi:hypothetical protein
MTTMTIQTHARRAALPSGETCRGNRHTGTNEAWRRGCRHPEAIAAHEEWKRTHSPDRMMPAAVDADGNCIADKHDSVRAYRSGCRHPKAIELWERNCQRRDQAKRVRRDIEYAAEFYKEEQRVRRLTGGRYRLDPRREWRKGAMAVDRHNLFMLLHGFIDSPNSGERLAALCRMQGRLVSDAWFKKARPMFAAEIGDAIGVTEQTALRMARKRKELAGDRARRRLADVQWRAAVAAAAAGRKDAERQRHEQVRAERKAAWKQHCRTMRRLRESRERAARTGR